ncbi:MAG: BamA/TamA family outer membrane protein [Gemmatimonadota bacterium]|nr:BamA/TamA family outer membrane protein [Gemmatimonadota bacterium]
MKRRTLQRALWVACLALAAAALPARARGQDITCDPGDQEVRSLVFRGNRAFSASDLEQRIVTTQSGWLRRHFGFFGTRHCLDPSELPLDVLRLRKLYHDRGYYDAKVDTLVQRLEPGAVRVTFTIAEGKPIVIDSLAIAGLDSVRDRAAILAGLPLRVGMAFDVAALAAEMDTITARMRNSGYPSVELLRNYTLRYPDSLIARVLIRAVPGPLTHIGAIRVRVTPVDSGGTQQIGDPVVLGLLGIRSGDLYSDQKLVAAQRNLYQLGAYRHVEVGLDPAQAPGDSLVTLDVDLREDYMHQLDTKYGWATLDCFRTSATYTDKNFLHQARHLELAGQLSKIGYGYPLASSSTRRLCYQDVLRRDPFSDTTNYSISATLTQPGLLGTAWSPTYSIYRERRSEYLAYLRTTLIGGEASATRSVGAGAALALSYTLEYGRTQAQPALLCAVFNRCDEQSRLQISRTAQPLAVAGAQYTLARTDDPFNPSSGFVLRTEVRNSSRILGSSSDLAFNKGTFDVSWYHPVGRSGVFASRLRAGVVVGPSLSLSDPTRYIPPEERLYAGGANSVRGFFQNELGSLLYVATGFDSVVVNDSTRYFRSPNGVAPFRVVPVGGNALLVANFEYRVPDVFFPRLLQWTFFTDGGEVWTRGTPGSALALSQIKWTPGVGIRVFTPVGPLQVNVGYNPYPSPRGPIYYDASVNRETGVAPLYCVSPGNTIPVHLLSGSSGPYAQDEQACPATFAPAQSAAFLRRLTLTFSIGPEF